MRSAAFFSDDWLDEGVAVAGRSLLWHGPVDNRTWPDGLPGWPDELETTDPVRQAVGEDRHLVGLVTANDKPASSIAIALLFGGQIACRLPLPGVKVAGSGPAWILDCRPGDPPSQEYFDAAIKRMLRERGWSDDQIKAARLP